MKNNKKIILRFCAIWITALVLIIGTIAIGYGKYTEAQQKTKEATQKMYMYYYMGDEDRMEEQNIEVEVLENKEKIYMNVMANSPIVIIALGLICTGAFMVKDNKKPRKTIIIEFIIAIVLLVLLYIINQFLIKMLC